jgi:lipoprotein-anchoring transpeptidase ErfK/SrfK
LGQPNSHGCVLLADADVIALFDRVSVGTLVYIR